MFSKNPEVIVQKNESGIVLLDMDSGKFYSLYDIAVDIWEYIEEELSYEEMIQRIIGSYNIPAEQASSDLETFLNELYKEKIIKQSF